LRKGDPLAVIGELNRNGDQVSATVVSKVDLKEANLHFAMASGPWQTREWKSAIAEIKDGRVLAKLPADRPLVCYLAVTDKRGLNVGTAHVILEK
jgi:hypothetical protein